MAKYRYYKAFCKDPVLRLHMPDTAICTRRALETYLNRYHTVFIKPDVGGKGEGVTKAWRTPYGYACIVEKGPPVYRASVQALYDHLGLAAKKRHVVQKALQLSEYRGRIFDVRVMLVRGPKRSWKVVGMLAKTAGRDSVITNILRGHGDVVDIDAALTESHGRRCDELKAEMIRLASRCNRMFAKIRYEWQMGYDFGVDTSGKVWLIEANPGNPSHALFRKLSDRTLYQNIKRAVYRYKKANG